MLTCDFRGRKAPQFVDDCHLMAYVFVILRYDLGRTGIKFGGDDGYFRVTVGWKTKSGGGIGSDLFLVGTDPPASFEKLRLEQHHPRQLSGSFAWLQIYTCYNALLTIETPLRISILVAIDRAEPQLADDKAPRPIHPNASAKCWQLRAEQRYDATPMSYRCAI